MDLTLGDHYVQDWRLDGQCIDPENQDSIDASLSHRIALPAAIPSKTRWLMYARERVYIPDGCIGLIGCRSTLARLGLMVSVTIADPRFQGHLTLEVFNSNENPIMLREGMKICSITQLAAIGEPPYEGRYQGQADAVVYPKALEA